MYYDVLLAMVSLIHSEENGRRDGVSVRGQVFMSHL